jgi:3',5'-nucleoside bisphosphate phosphatase
MPARQPFTALCQVAARPRLAGRADLHLHSTLSDGTYTPEQVVELARRCGLAAIALTDHDTLAGLAAARAAAGTNLEVVAGVEITTEHAGHELHLLAYFIHPDDAPLASALATIRQHRHARYHEMVRRLRDRGVFQDDLEPSTPVAPDALGRRHVAERLVRCGAVATIREAFTRYLKDDAPAAVPKWRLPVAEALALIRAAGGVASWAHPPPTAHFEQFVELRRLGLGAVEAVYPDLRGSRSRILQEYAVKLGLAISGGSDCHGPGPREIGCCTISADELQRLRPLP